MKPYVNAVTTVNASAATIWKVLTQPEYTAQYMFGCRVVSDWKPGSRVDWVDQSDGKDVTYVTGTVIEYAPNERLSYSVIDPFAEYPETEENHLTVCHTLTPEDGKIVLTVSQGDYTKVADGDKRYSHGADEGWLQLLNTIRDIAQGIEAQVSERLV